MRTLEDAAREASGCTRCRLAQGRTQVVYGVGNPHADLMFIGEGPGFYEDKQGEPFVGAAGQLLNRMLGEIGFQREDAYIANVVMCRPPGNRDPMPDEIEACTPWLMEKLELIDPRIIVTLGTSPALSFATDEICTDSEQGLLGVAVDPAFASNEFIYLFSSAEETPDCVNRVSRFTLPAGNVIDPLTELQLLNLIPSVTPNHNGGDLQFGKDGNLYVSVGDGGCDYALNSGCAGFNDASRDEHALVGKVLRIAPDGSIPADNPFQGAGTARCNVTGLTAPGNRCQETFAWGFRNPFRLGFDPNAAGTRFFINDVGQGFWEEIDLGQAARTTAGTAARGRTRTSRSRPARLRPAWTRSSSTRTSSRSRAPAAPPTAPA